MRRIPGPFNVSESHTPPPAYDRKPEYDKMNSLRAKTTYPHYAPKRQHRRLVMLSAGTALHGCHQSFDQTLFHQLASDSGTRLAA
jgi:hypothetical protein